MDPKQQPQQDDATPDASPEDVSRHVEIDDPDDDQQVASGDDISYDDATGSGNA